jgi:hypothetical protein
MRIARRKIMFELPKTQIEESKLNRENKPLLKNQSQSILFLRIFSRFI